ncbi:MAG TPA: SDR family oxidoreductase [Actinomycetota bacterium]|nr:SDR family oxidoreductase [Actinomycetota bacterium]
MELGLEGKRAVVTGGSKGLGRAIADELAREGAGVAVCARTPDEVERAGDELRAHGTTVLAEAADVTDPEQVRTFIARSAEALGGIDVLVNNAGRAHPGTFATLTDEDFRQDLDVKLFSQIRCSREALPHLRAAESGRIVNINAVYGRYPDPLFFATSTNRAACLAFTKALAMEVAEDGVLVNSVNIGFVVTPQWENIHRLRAPDVPAEEFFAQMAAAEVPLGRFGRADEVAGLVAFLAGARATYITGASIDVAGGMGRYL